MNKKQFNKGEWTTCQTTICEIKKDDEICCVVDIDYVDKVIDILEQNMQLTHDATVLIQSNQEYRKENDELKQYKQAVSDILWDWYRKDGSLTIWRIMKELNVDGDIDE